jgi:hypothetical protein
MRSSFHVIGFFHFVAIYGVLSDVTGWSTDELTNLLFYLISNLLLHTDQNPRLKNRECVVCNKHEER